MEGEGGKAGRRAVDDTHTHTRMYMHTHTWQEGQVLGQGALLEDIMQDYANRTVTVEAHPHTGLPQASIHPCQVRYTMKGSVVCGGRRQGTEE